MVSQGDSRFPLPSLKRRAARHYVVIIPPRLHSVVESLTSNDGNGNENLTWKKHLGNGDYFAIIASSSRSLLLTERAENG